MFSLPMINFKELRLFFSFILLTSFIFAEPTDGCDIDNFSLYVTSDGKVLYKSSEQIAGFQFDVDGIGGSSNNAYLGGANGGDAEEAGFTVSTGSYSGTVIGFSFTGSTVPAGCGILTTLESNIQFSSLSSIIVSNIECEDLRLKIDKVLELLSHHPFLVSNPENARKMAEFRIFSLKKF